MLGSANLLHTWNRWRAITGALAIAMALTVGLAALAPSAARASACTNSWTNAEGGNWFTASNWSKDAVPNSEEVACIALNGTYTVTMTQTSGTGTVSLKGLTIGGTSGTQTLALGDSCSENAQLTTAGLTNNADGVLVVTDGEGCGNKATLEGRVTNAGKIITEPGHGGKRQLRGNTTNTGTIDINTATLYNGSNVTLTNEGTIALAEAKNLTATSTNTITNGAGGSITQQKAGNVYMAHSTFNEDAGTTSGPQPVIVDDGTLSYAPGGGASTIGLRGSSALSGTTSSGQILSIQSTCSEHAVVTAASGLANGGKIKLTNAGGCGNNATLAIASGQLSNSGTLETEIAHGGQRNIQGAVVNTGALQINENTSYNGSEAQFTNEGQVKLGEGATLTVSNKGAFTNGAGGKIATTGSGNLLMSSGTSFTEGAGITTGTTPVIVDDGTLTYTGTGSSAIRLHGSNTLVGGPAKGQTLTLASTCGEHAFATSAAGFTNGGAITLTNDEGCGNNETLTVSSGTLTNTGTIITEPAHGGQRNLQGNIDNKGALEINENTAYNGTEAALTNEGAIDLAEGTTLTVSNKGAFSNDSGKIAATGSSDLLMSSGTSFTEGAGIATGTTPVIVDDGTLTYTGTGSSAIRLHGSNTLVGGPSAGQTLTLASTCGEHAFATSAAGFTNGGAITLTNDEGCGNNETLTVSSGTLTNTGTIITEPAHGGQRNLVGNITNKGTLELNVNTSASAIGATLLNEGALNIANGVSLAVTGAQTVTNGTGGTIAATGNGALVETEGTFNQGLGKETGSEPVILDNVALDYKEHGSGRISLRGNSSLGGSVKSDETLVLQSTCSQHAVITDAGNFSNKGTVEFTNGDGCGDNVTLNLSGGTFENGSVLDIDNPHGGSRTIEGNLSNTEGIVLASGTTLKVTGDYTQASTGKLTTDIASASSFGSLSVSGPASIVGMLAVHPEGSFKAALGEKFAFLSSSALSGTFTTVSGDVINTSGLYYKPTYSTTGATLVVTQATLEPSATSGLPGATVTLKGGGYGANELVTPSFTDHAGTVTKYSTVETNASGELSTEITIPVSAATGAGTIGVTGAATGVHLTAAFEVT
jgi:hypothetical protein